MNVSESIIVTYCVHDTVSYYPPGECCYWYRKIPATPSTCHGTKTRTVNLICEVEYWLQNISISIEIEWYRSRSKESAGNESGEIVTEYSQFEGESTLNQSLIRHYNIIQVLNFSISDRGYYWCQMVVNSIPLPPSPYGYISSSQCALQELSCVIDPPLCANNMSTRYIAHRQMNGTSCSKDVSKIILHTTETVTIPVSSFATTEITIVTTSSLPTTEIVSTIVAVIILFILIILVVLSIVYIKKRKSQSKLNTHDKLLYFFIYPNNTCLI